MRGTTQDRWLTRWQGLQAEAPRHSPVVPGTTGLAGGDGGLRARGCALCDWLLVPLAGGTVGSPVPDCLWQLKGAGSRGAQQGWPRVPGCGDFSAVSTSTWSHGAGALGCRCFSTVCQCGAE